MREFEVKGEGTMEEVATSHVTSPNFANNYMRLCLRRAYIIRCFLINDMYRLQLTHGSLCVHVELCSCLLSGYKGIKPTPEMSLFPTYSNCVACYPSTPKHSCLCNHQFSECKLRIVTDRHPIICFACASMKSILRVNSIGNIVSLGISLMKLSSQP